MYFFTQNSVGYLSPVFDPFFSANGTDQSIDLGFSRNLTKPDHLVNVMGCTDQFQVCNPTTSSCTPLGGLLNILKSMDTIGLNKAQLASAQRLYLASIFSSMYNSVAGLGASG